MPKRGSLHHLAKLDEELVRDIRKEYAEGGTSHVKLAVKYDLGVSTIGKMLRRETWTHV